MQITNVHLSGITFIGPATNQYWFSKIATVGNDRPTGIATSATNEIYVSGSSNSRTLTLKYSPLGDLSWQRRFTSVNTNGAEEVCVDSDGNVIISGNYLSTSMHLAKYNPSGNVIWQKTISNSRTYYGNTVDNSGNIYCVGSFNDGTNNIGLMKFHANGSVAWSRKLTGNYDNGDIGYGVSVDSTGNVYLTGQTYSSGGAGASDIYLAKYSGSGTLAWQRSIGGTGADTGYNVVNDHNDNVYVVGTLVESGRGQLFLAKYNTAGTIQWQRTLGSATTSQAGHDIAIDSTHVYVTGWTYAGNWDVLLAKYDFSGNIVWQRTVSVAGTTSPSDVGYGIAVDSLGAVCFAARVYNAVDAEYDILVGRLPNDGSLTGNYDIYTYAVSTLNSNTTTYTSNTRSLTSSVVSQSSSDASLSEAAANLVVSPKVIIG